MVTQVNRAPPTYTVKFTSMTGEVTLEDFQATGTRDAEDKFNAKYPGARLINIFRKG